MHINQKFLSTLGIVIVAAIFSAEMGIYFTGYTKGQEIQSKDQVPSFEMKTCFYLGNEIAMLDNTPGSKLVASEAALHCGVKPNEFTIGHTKEDK